jgi:hypothetical protein
MKIISHVVYRDYTNWVAGKDANGGHYSYSVEYNLINLRSLQYGTEQEPKYKVYHRTSADFQYCSGCGAFSDCNCEHEVIGAMELARLMNEPQDSDCYFEEPPQYVEVQSLDAEKLRRRVRDALNKTQDVSAILQIADILRV